MARSITYWYDLIITEKNNMPSLSALQPTVDNAQTLLNDVTTTRDNKDAFFYCDPPYFNSNCGHYDGYSLQDFENLLKTLSKLKGRFLLSSYPSPILKQYTKQMGWHQVELKQNVTVANNNSTKGQKQKTEVLTANYPIQL